MSFFALVFVMVVILGMGASLVLSFAFRALSFDPSDDYSQSPGHVVIASPAWQ